MKKRFFLSVWMMSILSTAFIALLLLGGSRNKCCAVQGVLEVPTKYPTIQQAIDAAQPGNTILVKPGVYKGGLFFKSGIKLIGTDKNACQITAMYGEPAILVAIGCSSGSIENLCFDGAISPDEKYEGMYILGVATEMQNGRCVVTKVMANSPAAKAGIKSGTIIYKCQKGKNEFTENLDLYLDPYLACGKDDEIILGIETDGSRKQVKLHPEKLYPEESLEKEWKKRTIGGPWPHGIVLLNSAINVKNCIVKSTLGTGIAVNGRQKCIIQKNECLSNGGNGIYLGEGTDSLVEGNVCKKNGFLCPAIVSADKGTAPEIKNNQCSESDYGIGFLDGGGGIAKGNTCEKNNHCGITFGKGDKGIAGANGIAEENICRKNFEQGIRVTDEGTVATLRKNECSNNVLSAIYFDKETRGEAEENICSENGGDIVVEEGAVVKLRRNKYLNNGSIKNNEWEFDDNERDKR